jgi:MFS family permease
MLPIELVFFQSLAAMPLFLVRDFGMTEAGFGVLLAVNTVIIILVEVPLNTAMADWDHRYSISLGALLVGAGFGALVFVTNIPIAVATVVIWTFGEMILLPASSAFVSDISPRVQSGAYMGLYTMGFSVALAVGPWLGSTILDRYGPTAVWMGTFVCGCITALMFWFMPKPLKENR